MATARLDSSRGRITLETEYRERELCKKVPGCKWDQDERTWWAPLSWATCVALRGVFGERLEIDEGLNAWAHQQRVERIDPCLALRQATEPTEPVYYQDKLEPMQAVCVEFLTKAQQALCGDGMGSGKTVEAICAVENLARHHGVDATFPALVVCTNTMVYQWEKEIKTWSPGREVAVLKGPINKRRAMLESGAAWYVINWEGLLAHTRLGSYGAIRLTDKERESKELNQIGLNTVVADEAHRGKNPKAKQTRGWWYLAHNANFNFALTGTPVVKSPEDLWSIMHGVCPEEWPSKTAWVDRYGLISWNMWGGMSVVGLRGDTQEELFKFLDPRFIRRPTQVVVPNIAEKLPPQVREIEMSPKQGKAYKQMRDDMIAEIDGGLAVETSQLTKTTRLIQLASAYAEVPDDNPDGFLMADPSNKVDALLDVIDELDGDSLVVFCQHKQLVNLASARLTKEKIEHGLITGDVSELDRAQYVQRFQTGDIPVILCTLAAGGEGITLTRARHVLFMQRSWSLKDNMQATDRVWRRGQDRPVQPIILVTKDTIESRVLALGAQRELVFEEVVRDAETLRALIA